MNHTQNQAVSGNDKYWSDLLRPVAIKADSSILYTTKLSFERREYQLHILQVSNDQLVPGDKTDFAVSGADWLQIVAESRASQDAAQDRVALGNGDSSSRFTEFMAPWYCSAKKQVYLRSTCYMDPNVVVLEPGQCECLLCGTDVVETERAVQPTSAGGEVTFRKVGEDECRPALSFERLVKRNENGSIDTDCPTRKGQHMDINRPNFDPVRNPPSLSDFSGASYTGPRTQPNEALLQTYQRAMAGQGKIECLGKRVARRLFDK